MIRENGLVIAGIGLTTAASAQTAPAGPPAQYVASCSMASGAGSCSTSIQTPNGKYLVIQTINAYRYDSPSGIEHVYIAPTVNGVQGTYSVTVPGPDGAVYPGTTISATLYAGASQPIGVFVYRGSSTGSETVSISLSGYLIPKS